MERAVGRQQLKRKIIFIACDSFQCAAGGESRHNRSMTRVKVTVRRDDCITNRFRPPATRISIQISGKKSTFAARHVAVPAAALVEENLAAVSRGARQLCGGGGPLQRSKGGDNRGPRFRVQKTERGQRRVRNTLLQNLQ